MINILTWLDGAIPIVAVNVILYRRWSKLLRARMVLWLSGIAFFVALTEVGAWIAADDPDMVAISTWMAIGAGGTWLLLRVLMPYIRREDQNRPRSFHRGPGW